MNYIKYNFVFEYPIESFKWNDTMSQLQQSISDLFGNTIAGTRIKDGLYDILLAYMLATSSSIYSTGSHNITELEKLTDAITTNFDKLKDA